MRRINVLVCTLNIYIYIHTNRIYFYSFSWTLGLTPSMWAKSLCWIQYKTDLRPVCVMVLSHRHHRPSLQCLYHLNHPHPNVAKLLLYGALSCGTPCLETHTTKLSILLQIFDLLLLYGFFVTDDVGYNYFNYFILFMFWIIFAFIILLLYSTL